MMQPETDPRRRSPLFCWLCWGGIFVLWLAGFVGLASNEGPLNQSWKTNEWQKQPPTVLWPLKQAKVLAEVPFLVGLGAVLTVVCYLQKRKTLGGTTEALQQTSRFLMRYVACGLAAAIVPNVVKLIIPRLRPKEFDGGNAWYSFLHSGQAPLPFRYEHYWQSFPSAHTVAAFCIAGAIFITWPNRWVRGLVFLPALAVGVSRFWTLAHFPSDIWTGLFMGCILAWAVNHGMKKWLPEQTPVGL